MAWYKDNTQSIGYSDVASVVLRGIQDGKQVVKLLNFGEDGDYKAYIVEDRDLIPEHYFLKEAFNYWMDIYDDETCTLKLKGDVIEVYTAGMRGCLILIESHVF